MRLQNSIALYKDASKVTSGGVHSNVRFRDPYPIFFKKGKGSRIWDVDGNEYLDLICNLGALILGHGDEDVIQNIKDYLDIGLSSAVETELSVEVAKKLSEMIPCAEVVKFSNTGTEAVMHAIQIARGYTGKERILKFEGHYHGWYDYVLCSHLYPFDKWSLPRPYPSSNGLCRALEDTTLVCRWNDINSLVGLIEEYKDEIAAIILDPIASGVGCTLPNEGYLEEIRRLTQKEGIVLIFDEVITGFRVSSGGAQEYFGVTPDLATFGKAIANGFPLSAVVGKKNIMKITSPKPKKVFFAGTYNGNLVGLAAASVTLEKLKSKALREQLNRQTARLMQGMNSIFSKQGSPAKIAGLGGMVQVYFTSEDVVDLRSAATSDEAKYIELKERMFENGILWPRSNYSRSFLTSEHSETDIDNILSTIQKIIQADTYNSIPSKLS
jgi:glutamate-1-semialdehyde 2,1-aminomutase